MFPLALLAIFGGSFLVGLSGALAPGPLTVLTARESLRFGFWAGPLATLGHGLIELLLVVALTLGLSALVRQEGPQAAAIALLGDLFLLWMGLGSLRRLAEQPPPLAHPRAGPGLGPHEIGDFVGCPGLRAMGLIPWAAVLASAANPYWLLWWASLGMASLRESLAYGAAGALAFYGGHVLADLSWLSLVAAALAGGRRVLSPQLHRALLAAFGLMLGALGLFFLARGAFLALA